MRFLKSPDSAAISLALALGTVHFSPALASIFTGIATLFCILIVKDQFPWKATLSILGMFLVILLINFKHSQAGLFNISRITIYVPLLFVPIFHKTFKLLDLKKLHLYFLGIPLIWIVIASILNYLNHYQFLSQMVLESKPLPLFSDVYHIEFSFILTSVLLFLGMYLWSNQQQIRDHYDVVIQFLILFLAMHILSARTGLLAFWTAVMVWVLMEGKSVIMRHLKIGFISIAALVVFAFVTPSIKNRVLNTAEDLSAVVHGGDLNNKSFGQRWEAWRSSFVMIKKNSLWGVGSDNKDQALMEGHRIIKSQLKIENQVQPHNQWIQWALEWGLVFIGISVILIVWALKGHNSMMIIMSFIAIFVATLFESIFERQAGVLAVLFLLAISGVEFTKKSKLSENSQ